MHSDTEPSSGMARDHSILRTENRAGRRLPGWRSRDMARVAGVRVAVIAAGSAVGLALSSLVGLAPASASTGVGWAMTAGNVQSLSQQDPATAAHFFNTPTSYGAGASLVQSPVQKGYATTPVLAYSSFARFKSDIGKGGIAYPYHWVMYDPEKWSATPLSEQQDPIKYMRLFGQLAHTHGLKAIMAPALDLAYVLGSIFPRLPRESAAQWDVRVNIASAAAAYGDIFVLQDESNIPDLTQYDWLFNNVNAQAQAAKSSIRVYAEVSTVNGSAGQMANAAQSVSADGYYVAAPGAIPQADKFFHDMQAAGY